MRAWPGWFAIGAFVLTLFPSPPTNAEPSFAIRTGYSCSQCHVNRTGGGLRTPFGSLYTQTILPEETHVVTDSALRSTLARCRDLTPEDYATDTECRAAWEAARQRFFDLAPEPAGTE